MALVSLNPRVESQIRDAKLVKKAKEEKRQETKKKSNALLDIINDIRKDVDTNLGEFKDQYQIIYDLSKFEEFIDKANEIGYIAIDTETTGLNPLVDKIVGLCLYVPDEKPTYVPINHVDYITSERYEEQLTEEQLKHGMDRLTAKIIMFNATFDIRVIRHTIGSYLKCYWDTSVASKCMNENEPKNKLKPLHQKYVLRGRTDEKNFADFFGNITFDRIPIDCAYLYAAHDAIITYELFMFQSQFLRPDARQDLADVYDLFMNIEMPVVDVVCDMEDTGVMLDMEYTMGYLMPKYKKIAEEKLNICQEEIHKHDFELAEYKRKNPNHKLGDPINIDSPTQLAIFLYDILKVPPKDKKQPRGTGEDILLKINNTFTNALLDYRSAQKLLRTYIEKMPNVVLKDGRVHCRYHQYGAKTGRFSSTDPNMQNIPSDNDEIRKMFTGGTITEDIEDNNNVFIFNKSQEVEIDDGNWVFVEKLSVGDSLQTDSGYVKIIKMKVEPGLTGKVWIRVE